MFRLFRASKAAGLLEYTARAKIKRKLDYIRLSNFPRIIGTLDIHVVN